MLFLKYISDLWKDHYEAVQEGVRRRRGAHPAAAEARAVRRCRRTATFDALYAPARTPPTSASSSTSPWKPSRRPTRRSSKTSSATSTSTPKPAWARPRSATRRLKILLEDFNDPRLDLRPSRGRQPGRHRRRLRVPDRPVRRRRRQEGRRVLHAARGVAPAGPAGRSQAGRPHLRPGLRLRLAADPAWPSRSARTDFSLFGQENNGSTWALGQDEHVPARAWTTPASSGATRSATRSWSRTTGS